MPKTPRKEDAFDLFSRALGTGSSGKAIMGQEAAGQQSFVKSETLPTQMSPQDRAILINAGVVFGEIVPNDDLFQYVQLPAGWTKSSTDHSMHNNLLDNKGRKRAGIFYKAAFYDRRADLHCVRRFGIELDYGQLDKGIAVAIVTDGGSAIFTTDSIDFSEGEKDSAQEAVGNQAQAWLNEHYPDWESTSAYWD